MESKSDNIKAALIHLGGICQYVFPLGNIIAPLVLWGIMKDQSKSLDNHGRREINFQLSLIVYTIVLGAIAIPILAFGILSHVPFHMYWDGSFHAFSQISPADITGVTVVAIICLGIMGLMYLISFFLVLIAAVKAIDGNVYKYPGCIPFLKYVSEDATPAFNTSSLSPEQTKSEVTQ